MFANSIGSNRLASTDSVGLCDSIAMEQCSRGVSDGRASSGAHRPHGARTAPKIREMKIEMKTVDPRGLSDNGE